MSNKSGAVVYVDVNNIFHRFKKLDWIKLRQWISNKYNIERMNAYNSIDHTNQNQIKFNTYLSNNGYRVIDPDINVMTNVDPIIITQMLNDSNTLGHKVVVLIACDGGYSWPLDELSKAGYKIHVIGCSGNTNLELLKVSDHIDYLDQIEGIVI